jgi:hypothetical protein
MRTLARWFPLSMILLAPLTAGAQEQAAPEGAPPAAPAPAPVEAAPAPAPVPVAAAPAPTAPPVAFTWEALADMYYLYNFTGNPSTQGPAARAFDQTANNFALNYAKLGVGVDTESVAFRLDLGAGHTAAIINAASNGYVAAGFPAKDASGNPAALTKLSSSDFLIQQAFGTWKITKDITFDAGRFVTTAGAEVIEANKNWLYSRSFLFNGIPFLHNGIRLNAAITPAIKLQLGLVNGWNYDVDNNRGKTGEVSVAFTPPDSDNTNVILTSYFGKEGDVKGGPTKVLVDGVFSRDFGKLSLNLNIDYLRNGSDPWWLGAALMGRYFLTDSFNVAARGEYIKSKKGGIDNGTEDLALYEGTLMGGYVVAKHFELRAEVRADFCDKDIVFKKGADARKNQVTGTIAALTYF